MRMMDIEIADRHHPEKTSLVAAHREMANAPLLHDGGGLVESRPCLAADDVARHHVLDRRRSRVAAIGDDSTDDIRPGLGYEGLEHLRTFVEKGGLLITSEDTAQFAPET